MVVQRETFCDTEEEKYMQTLVGIIKFSLATKPFSHTYMRKKEISTQIDNQLNPVVF